MLSHMMSRGVIGLVLGVALLVGACGAPTQQGAQQQDAGQPAYPSLHIRLESDRFLITKPEELCDPLLTAEVMVGAHGTTRWNTTDGKRPPLATGAEIMKQGYFIYGTVSFTQMTPLRDRRTAPTASYITLGGQVGADSYSVDGSPLLVGTGGHYVVVFSRPTSTNGLPTADTLIASYAFPVDTQGNVVLQQAGNPNEPGTGTVQPEIKVALSDLKQTLASCKA